MDEGRTRSLYLALAHSDGEPLTALKAVCHGCVEVLEVAGAGVMLMADRVHQGTVYATDGTIQALEELQNAASEGPCIDAYTLGRPVLEPDLAGAGARAWPVLAPGALDAGMRALFSFPLQLDDTCVGALNLYRRQPGHLTSADLHDSRLLAAIAARAVLSMQSAAVPGSLPSQIADLSGDRAGIEQATGMIAAQLDVTIVQAARRLREFASELDRPLPDIAREFVARRHRFN